MWSFEYREPTSFEIFVGHASSVFPLLRVFPRQRTSQRPNVKSGDPNGLTLVRTKGTKDTIHCRLRKDGDVSIIIILLQKF